MSTTSRRILIVGGREPFRLECSYETAFRRLAHEALVWDIMATVRRYTRLGRAGRLFNQFVPVEIWERKANREMVLFAAQFRPEVILVAGAAPVQAGALAQLRQMIGRRLVWLWPDTLVNLTSGALLCLPLYDLVATYSQSSVTTFERLGAHSTAWVPLAGDPFLHPKPDSSEPARRAESIDVSFIGGWRPEREAVLSSLGDFDLKIWGPDWDRRSRGNPVIRRSWQNRPIFSAEFARVIFRSKINLNMIDPTNYPAANMRFFEIPVAGGLQVSSPCPEMAEEFRPGEHLFYYERPEQLPALIRELLQNEPMRRRVQEAGYEQVMHGHTYQHRAQQILTALDEQGGHRA